MNIHLDPRTVAQMLGGTVAAGGRVLCPGPGHSPRDRSLSVRVDPNAPGGLLVHSFSGDDPLVCKDFVRERLRFPAFAPGEGGTYKSTLKHFSKPASPVAPPKPFNDGPVIQQGYQFVVAYDYTDRAGAVLYQVLRYEHPNPPPGLDRKTFLQRRPDGHGGWFGRTSDIAKVPYRLAEFDRYAHDMIFVTEGEKDADRLAGLSHRATTVASGSWTADVIQEFAGYDVMILEDNDKTGREKAEKAARALHGVAASIRVVQLPGLAEGGDVSDWLDEDADRAESLVDLARSSPLWSPVEKTEEAPKTEEPTPLIKATPFVWRPPEIIPPREWLYGRHMIRKYASATFAAGGVGKSSLLIAESLAMASGRDLLGHKPTKPLRVWLWMGEDPLEESERRVGAAMMHYAIKAEDIADRLFVDSGRDTRLVLAEQTKDGARILRPMADALLAELTANSIDVLVIDPFVSSHKVTENDNNAIDLVAKEWAAIAGKANCAVELVHHVRKTGGQEATVEDGRGASALLAAVRSARVLNGMTEDEAAKAGVENHRQFFRVSNGKANLTLPSPKADWFTLADTALGNGRGFYPEGDRVGVVTTWTWPDAFSGITTVDLLKAQRAVDGGKWRKDPQASAWVGNPIMTALGMVPTSKADRAKVKTLLATWTANGAFREVEGQDETRRVRVFVEVGGWATS